MSRIYNALIELVAAAVFIIPLWGIYDLWILSGSSISISGISEYHDVANGVYSESDSIYLYVVRFC